jgi:D-alanyl-D-alanine dipeptidase
MSTLGKDQLCKYDCYRNVQIIYIAWNTYKDPELYRKLIYFYMKRPLYFLALSNTQKSWQIRSSETLSTHSGNEIDCGLWGHDAM